ncbi:MAG: hypothetical protein GVY07_06780 [Bacteroidetes bacterium]|nr:hypothetical protein [Bacteroidota bacterium]
MSINSSCHGIDQIQHVGRHTVENRSIYWFFDIEYAQYQLFRTEQHG